LIIPSLWKSPTSGRRDGFSSPRHSYGLHSWHGFFPAWIASSRVAYLTRFLAEIFAADLQPALWKTCEFFDAK